MLANLLSLILQAVLTVVPIAAVAQIPDRSEFANQWGPTTYKQIIEEVTYVVKIQKSLVEKTFVLKTDLSSNRTQECAAENPEQVVKNWLDRMSSLSYSMALQCWDAESRIKLQQLDKDAKKSTLNWETEWKKTFYNNKATLSARIDLGQFVLIEYRILNTSGKEVILYETVSLKKVANLWLLTLALVETPVPGHWDEKSNRVQRVFNPATFR